MSGSYRPGLADRRSAGQPPAGTERRTRIHRGLEQWARRATASMAFASSHLVTSRASFERTETPRRLRSIARSARRRARGKAVTLQNRGAHRERILPLFPRLAARIEVAQFPSLQFTKDMRRLARWVSSTAPPPRPMVLTVSTHCPCPRNCPRRRTTQRILRLSSHCNGAAIRPMKLRIIRVFQDFAFRVFGIENRSVDSSILSLATHLRSPVFTSELSWRATPLESIHERATVGQATFARLHFVNELRLAGHAKGRSHPRAGVEVSPRRTVALTTVNRAPSQGSRASASRTSATSLSTENRNPEPPPDWL